MILSKPIKSLAKFAILPLLISFSLFITTSEVYAGHLKGSSLTWRCIKSGPDQGKFVFIAKKYGLCGGIPQPTTVTVTNPFGAAITCNRVGNRDLAPVCSPSGTPVDCYTGFNRGLAIEEVTYESAPVTLVGTPSTSGSVFSMTDCCRLAGITNVSSTGSFFTQAIMYPYFENGAALPVGTTGNPSCYDSAPQFSEGPTIISRAGIETFMDFSATDEEANDLTFSFSPGKTSSTMNVSYRLGYSHTNPLPDATIDPANTGATINSESGIVNFLSVTTGLFTMSVEVEAKKCGQTISKTYLEYPMQIVDSNTVNGFDSIDNVAPVIQFSSAKKGSGLTVYRDTVFVNDTVEFDILALDNQLLDSNNRQTITLTAISEMFGTGYASTTSGCVGNRCATMDISPSSWDGAAWVDSIQVGSSFFWVPDCSVMEGESCLIPNTKTFHFLFKAKDNFCAVPGERNASAFITVMPRFDNRVEFDSVEVQNNTSITLNWKQFTGAGFSKYYIFRRADTSSTLELIDSVANVSTTTYSDVNVTIDTVTYTYTIRTSIDSLGVCNASDFFSSIYLEAKKNNNGTVDLEWNSPIIVPINDTLKYEIWKADSSGNFVFVDTTRTNSFLDTITSCSLIQYYLIKATSEDTTVSISNIDTIRIERFNNYIPIVNDLHTDTGGNVLVTWERSTIPLDKFNAYVLYSSIDSTGPYTTIDSIRNINATSYLHNGARGHNSQQYYHVAEWAYSECLRTVETTKRSDMLRNIGIEFTNTNNGYVKIDWTPFAERRSKSATGNYILDKKIGILPYAIVDSTTAGNETYSDTIELCNIDLTYRVTVDSTTHTISAENVVNIKQYAGILNLLNDSTLSGPTGVAYNWYRNDSLIQHSTNQYVPTRNGRYRVEVILNNGCIIRTNAIDFFLTGIAESVTKDQIVIAPNPNDGKFSVRLPLKYGERASLEIYGITGKRILEKEFTHSNNNLSHEEVIDLNHVEQGIYLIKVNTQEFSTVKRIIIR